MMIGMLMMIVALLSVFVVVSTHSRFIGKGNVVHARLS